MNAVYEAEKNKTKQNKIKKQTKNYLTLWLWFCFTATSAFLCTSGLCSFICQSHNFFCDYTNEDTLLPAQMFPRLSARATFVADTKNVSQFAQLKRHHEQQCVRNNIMFPCLPVPYATSYLHSSINFHAFR